MIAIYAITDDPPAESHGLTAVPRDGLVALCSPAEPEAELTPARLWRHEELLESLMEQCDLLPVRYGTHVEDESEAERILADRHGELLTALERVRGAVEVSLRLFAAQAGATGEAIHTELATFARESADHAPSDEHELIRKAYLIDRDRTAAFAARVGELQAANPELRLLCTGPWPPYSFTGR